MLGIIFVMLIHGQLLCHYRREPACGGNLPQRLHG